MTRTNDISTVPRSNGDRLKTALDTFFAGIGQGVNAYLAAISRTDQLERLNALSDEQLAEMGLKREDIPSYVFRDVLH